jgi:hypothetical protein
MRIGAFSKRLFSGLTHPFVWIILLGLLVLFLSWIRVTREIRAIDAQLEIIHHQ